jgi:AbrB family looped-hinge helix DNA binding protein
MARVTSKGQVTIPVKIRRALDIEPGDELLFDLDGEGTRVQVRKRTRLTSLFGALPATRPFPGKAEVRKEVGQGLGERRRKASP